MAFPTLPRAASSREQPRTEDKAGAGARGGNSSSSAHRVRCWHLRMRCRPRSRVQCLPWGCVARRGDERNGLPTRAAGTFIHGDNHQILPDALQPKRRCEQCSLDVGVVVCVLWGLLCVLCCRSGNLSARRASLLGGRLMHGAFSGSSGTPPPTTRSVCPPPSPATRLWVCATPAGCGTTARTRLPVPLTPLRAAPTRRASIKRPLAVSVGSFARQEAEALDFGGRVLTSV